MPGARHDKLFGGQPGAAAKALASMQQIYGRKKGQQVYDATIIKRERKAKSASRKPK